MFKNFPLPPLPPPLSKNENTNDLCGIFNKTVKDNDKALICDKCGKWVHAKCTKMPSIKYEHHQINPEDIFECRKCRTCSVCHKVIASNQKFIDCSACRNYVHIKCNLFDSKQYDQHKEKTNPVIFCVKCNKENLPFFDLKHKEFDLTMDGINYPEETDISSLALNESQLSIINKLNKVVNEHSNSITDIDTDDDNDVPFIDCHYFSVEEFKKMKFNSSREFSILHLNIHSVEAHIEELRIALQLIEYKFDFICLSESKLKVNSDPKVDIRIKNYQPPVGTPSVAAKGGVLIYAKDGINFEPRIDLCIYKEKELESYFIEVINDKQRNSIIGVVYRHPCMEENSFIGDYIEPLNDKLQCENKEIFIAGDFNFDLLKLHHPETSKFFEAMTSAQLLPSILLPTKINSKNDTIIDNIFSNQISPDIKSGNLTITISDHLPSFFIKPKDNQLHLPKNNKYLYET